MSVKHNLLFSSRLGQAPDMLVHLVYKRLLLVFRQKVVPEEDTGEGEGCRVSILTDC